MYESVNTGFEFNEYTEVCQITNDTSMLGINRIFLHEVLPGIGLELLHSEGKLFVFFINIKHNSFNYLPHRNDLRGVLNVLSPGHFTNMYKAFDSFFNFNESAVISKADDFTADLSAFFVFVADGIPWMGSKLFHAERDSFFIFVEIKYNDFNDLIKLNDLRRMGDASP